MVRLLLNRLIRARAFGVCQAQDSRVGSDDGNGLESFDTAADRHTEASRGCIAVNDMRCRRSRRETVLGDLVGNIVQHLKKGERSVSAASAFSGPQARRSHWPQSRNRRTNSDQSQQESRIPRFKRAEGIDLTTTCLTLRGLTAGAEQQAPACRSVFAEPVSRASLDRTRLEVVASIG